ncbi:hypothetical protein ABBQ38_012730 [Trebouxia sp. C0009 RCD-2024]
MAAPDFPVDATVALLDDEHRASPTGAKQKSTLLTVCPFILGNEFCERLAFYGLSTNMVIYLTRIMGCRPAFAATQVNLFEGTCYLTPVLGAWLADAHWGRYKTILVFSGIYFVGMVTLALSTWIPGLQPPHEGDSANWIQNLALYGSLYIVALGTGGIKPNVSAFGADQFDMSNAQDRKEKDSFFNWFYFAINLGSFLAVTTLVYIQESVSWTIGFAIPAAAMLLAVVTFVAGSSKYVHVEPTESPMSRVVKVLWVASRARGKKTDRRQIAGNDYTGPVNLPPDTAGLRAGMGMRKNRSYQWLEAACDPEATSPPETGRVGGYTAAQVEEVRMVMRMLPIFFTTILFWTIYCQMGSFFVEQGTQMNRQMFGGKLRIPAASLALFNTISIIALIPVYDRVLVPSLRYFGKQITLLQRIGWGLLVCVFAMLAAAAVEWYRLKLFHEGKVLPALGGSPGHSILSHRDGSGIVDMNVFWQVPQYLLVGLSEVLASIGQLEFFYDQAPDVMRSCSMALQLLSVAAGSYLSGAVVVAVSSATGRGGKNGWLPDDLNNGRLDLFFLFLAGLMVLNLVWFLWVVRSFEYKAVEHPSMRTAPATTYKPPAWAQAQVVSGVQPANINIAGQRISPDEDVGLYGRSVTFVPASPIYPAPFR